MLSWNNSPCSQKQVVRRKPSNTSRQGILTLRHLFPALGTQWILITLCYAHPSFQPSSWVEQIHFQYLLNAFQLLHNFPWSDGSEDMNLVFWMLSFKPGFSLSYFTFIKRFFSSSLLSAIRVVSTYLWLLVFLLAILIPACNSSSPGFHMRYFAYKLNKQVTIYSLDILCFQFWTSPFFHVWFLLLPLNLHAGFWGGM